MHFSFNYRNIEDVSEQILQRFMGIMTRNNHELQQKLNHSTKHLNRLEH